ncbi:MAG TPA: Calx-beta domain-containing protein [Chthoniobacterales bacterium]|jgi:hypothetical protein
MKSKLIYCLLTLVGVFALQPAAYATFHLMQIEQVIGAVDGDTTAQAIQLRMRAAGQNFVSGGKLVVFDATGSNPITVLDVPTDVVNGQVGDRVLIASANFPSHTTPPAMPDFTMTNLIPTSYFAAGSLIWQNKTTGEILWRLSWGGAAYTGPTTGSTDNDADGNFGVFPSPLPSACSTAFLFPGAATAKSTTNAADYVQTTGNIVFTNNARVGFTITVTLPTVTLTAPDPNATEGADNGTFRITRTGGCNGNALSVFFTISGTATNGSDYKRLRSPATIPATRPAMNVAVKPIDDTIPEPDETVILTLSPNAGYTIGSPSTATVTIHSNE